jgi:ABC-type iron transport system FetAB permease component
VPGKSVLLKCLNRLKAFGLVIIPGSMAGMIIGGTDSVRAAEYQLVIMLLIFTAVIATSLIQGEYPLPEHGG